MNKYYEQYIYQLQPQAVTIQMMHNLFKLNTFCNQRPKKISKPTTSVAMQKLKQHMSVRNKRKLIINSSFVSFDFR